MPISYKNVILLTLIYNFIDCITVIFPGKKSIEKVDKYEMIKTNAKASLVASFSSDSSEPIFKCKQCSYPFYTQIAPAVGASSQCYWDELMLLKCELMLLKFELMPLKCQINTKLWWNWQT